MEPFEQNIFYFWTKSASGAREQRAPDWMRESMACWARFHPGFTIERIDEGRVLDLLQSAHPTLARLYSSITIPACKSDIARLVYLEAFGGIYVDAHTVCTKSLGPVLRERAENQVLLPFHPEHLEEPLGFAHPFP